MPENDNNPNDRDDQNDDGQNDDQNDDGQNDDADDQNDDYNPPDKAEWDKVVGTIGKQKATAKGLRQQIAELKAELAKGKDGDDKDKDDAPKVDPDVKVKRLAVVAALAGEGLTKAQAKLAARLVDLDEVEVDDDGDADLDDVLSELKETLPSLFTAGGSGGDSRPRPRTGGGRNRSGGDTRNSDDKHNDRLLRSAGYK